MKHPDEVPALVMLKIAAMRAKRAIPKDENLAFCYKMLNRVSRSFSIVIQQLKPAPLRDAVINFCHHRHRSLGEFVRGLCIPRCHYFVAFWHCRCNAVIISPNVLTFWAFLTLDIKAAGNCQSVSVGENITNVGPVYR